jgi:GTPase SAR1 family protein
MCLLLGATGVGKTLLVKRLQKLTLRDGSSEIGETPVTLPTGSTLDNQKQCDNNLEFVEFAV